MITRNFNLYLNAGVSVAPVINVNQYDRGEQWIFTLWADDGSKVTPTSGMIVGIKSDNNIITNAGSVNSSGQVVITETEQMTAAAGKAVFELRLNDATHGTANFIVACEPSPIDGGVVSDSDISVIEKAVDLLTATHDVDEILNALNVTEQRAASATASANSAQTSANQAASSASIAETYRNEAKEYRDEASAIVGTSLYSLMVDSDGYICLNYTGGDN